MFVAMMPDGSLRKHREGGRKRISLISDGNSEGTSSTTTVDTGKWTSKNVECILTILHLVHQHGDVLDTAWHLVLTTLQVSSKVVCSGGIFL